MQIANFLIFFLLLSCGKERWPVKTLDDVDAKNINRSAMISSTVSEANTFEAPKSLPEVRRLPREFYTYAITGYLLGFKLETDGDFHIVIQDLNTRETMIVEMPAPNCMPAEYGASEIKLRSSFVKRFGQPRTKFRNVRAHRIKVRVVGVGFFDFIHGQSGAARNGFELHPLLDWEEAR